MLLSRLAETLFWFGRYLERAEDVARAISAREQLCLDLPAEWSPGWAPLVALCGDAAADLGNAACERGAVLRFLIADPGCRSSVLGIVAQAREDLRMSRPIVPKETWHTLNAAHLSLLEVSRQPSLVRLNAVLDEVIAACQQVHAQLSAAMIHDHAYAFIRIGRYVERADMLLRIATALRAFDAEAASRPFANLRWIADLNALGAYQMYRRSHHGRVDPSSAWSFLLTEVRFPRSLNHCIREVQRQLTGLPRGAELQAACEQCKAPAAWKAAPPEAMSYAEGRLAEVENLATAIATVYFH